MNLVGGQTAALVLLGKRINVTGACKGRAKVRGASGMIGVSDAAWDGTPLP